LIKLPLRDAARIVHLRECSEDGSQKAEQAVDDHVAVGNCIRCDVDGVAGLGDSGPGVHELEDWEDGIESMGIAKCAHCGMKLPLDDDAAIEAHMRECKGDGSQKAEQAVDDDVACGNCIRCDVDGVAGLGDSGLGVHELEDWEDGLDSMSIAKCAQCGLKLPLDDAAIETHMRECKGDGSQKAEQADDDHVAFGNCTRCMQRMRMDVDSIVEHSRICPGLRSGGPPPGECGMIPGLWQWLSNSSKPRG